MNLCMSAHNCVLGSIFANLLYVRDVNLVLLLLLLLLLLFLFKPFLLDIIILTRSLFFSYYKFIYIFLSPLNLSENILVDAFSTFFSHHFSMV
jgi:hypothetical protein